MEDLQPIILPVEEEFEQFQTQYRQTLLTDNHLLTQAISHLLQRTGKQLRPLLVLLSAKACRPTISPKTIDTSVALELLHTATLIHDDVVDQSLTRRAQPSINARFTNNIAVLLGDYLLAQAIETTANIRNQQIINIIASIGKQLAAGELLQLDYSAIPLNGTMQPREINAANMPTEEQYMQIISQKTAALFAACCAAGAVSNGASPKQINALTAYGKQLGLCFQMQDDMLDYSDSEELGKPTMNDIREGKLTLPLICALQRATKDEQIHIFATIQQLQQTTDDRFALEQDIKSFVLRYDGLRYTQQRILERYHTAIFELQKFPQDQPAVQALLQLLRFTFNRLA